MCPVLLTILLALMGHWGSLTLGQQHHQFDPAYLRQYYQQLQLQQQNAPQQHATSTPDGTPIYEHNVEQQQQYSETGQQTRAKDNAQEQIRVQQQSQANYVAPAIREYLQRQPQLQQQQQYSSQPQHVLYHQTQPQNVGLVHRKPSHIVQQYQSTVKSKGKGQLPEEEEQEYDDNSSYQFGFDVKDDEFTNYQNRKEVRDGGVIKGSYSVVDSDGFIRTVKYTADPKEGFKAEVIREPTDIVVKIPTQAPQTLFRHRTAEKAQLYSPKTQMDY